MKLQQVSDSRFAVPDHPDRIEPSAEVAISFEPLGRLRCRFAVPARRLPTSRWPLQPAQQSFRGP
jgi:hypothetical protein